MNWTVVKGTYNSQNSCKQHTVNYTNKTSSGQNDVIVAMMLPLSPDHWQTETFDNAN